MDYKEPTSINRDDLVKENARFVLFEEPRFTVYGEFKGGHLFLHCSKIKVWSRSTYVACLEAMNIIKAQAHKQGIEHIYAFVFIHKIKFMTMMGFTPYWFYEDDQGRSLVLGIQHTDGSPIKCAQ